MIDRLKAVFGSHALLLLAALALLSLALGSAMFSGASFSSKSANSAALAAGSVQLSSSKPGEAIVAASGMKPGESRQGTISIGNEGDVPGSVVLKATSLSGAALAGAINLKIEDTTSGTSQKWSGGLDSFTSLQLGSFAANETRSYRFTLSWPAVSDSPALQGASASLTFKWEGSS